METDAAVRAAIHQAHRALGVVLAPDRTRFISAREAETEAMNRYRAILDWASEGSRPAADEVHRIYADSANAARIGIREVHLLMALKGEDQRGLFLSRDMPTERMIEICSTKELEGLRPAALASLVDLTLGRSDRAAAAYIVAQPDTDPGILRSLLADGRHQRTLGLSKVYLIAHLPLSDVLTWARRLSHHELAQLWEQRGDAETQSALAPLLIASATSANDEALLRQLASNDDDRVRLHASTALLRLWTAQLLVYAPPPTTPTHRWWQEANTATSRIEAQSAELLGDQSLRGSDFTFARTLLDETIAQVHITSRTVMGSLVEQELRECFEEPVVDYRSWRRLAHHRRRKAEAFLLKDPDLASPTLAQIITYALAHGDAWGQRFHSPSLIIAEWERDGVCPLCGSWRQTRWEHCGGCGARLRR